MKIHCYAAKKEPQTSLSGRFEREFCICYRYYVLIAGKFYAEITNRIYSDLGEHFAAIPGQFRINDVASATYRWFDYRNFPVLTEKFCPRSKEAFGYEKKYQPFSEVVIQVIVILRFLLLEIA